MQNPKNILITGASSGLGAALACFYAAPGRSLFLSGRNIENLTRVTVQCRGRGATVTPFQADVTDRAEMGAALQKIDRDSPIDLLFANAGISAGTVSGPESEAQSRLVFETNFYGVLNTLHPVLPGMMKRKRGQIALISSLAGYRSVLGAPAYSASKAAVRLYGETLRYDLAQQNVELNVVCPGFIDTPMTAKNKYPMPFIISADRAASLIAEGLLKNRALIAFPTRLRCLLALSTFLPSDWVLSKMARFPRKGA